MTTKQIYEQPRIRSHGQVEAMTQGNATGTNLDQGFVAGTVPTFS